jgi:hypothetical protein
VGIRALLTVALLCAGCAWGEDVPDLRASYDFLVSLRSKGAGVLQERGVPYSFIDSEQYWGEYVCSQPATVCAVADYYDPADYGLKPRAGAAGDLQIERVNVHNGTNIYDAATWQIAVMLGAAINHYPHLVRAEAYVPEKRATTEGEHFIYNGAVVRQPQAAYAFRMLSPAWLVEDPLAQSRYSSLVTVTGLPLGRPEYRRGVLSWSDWKPVTGENAWAFLIGPLQAAYLHHVIERKGAFVPFRDAAVQNALAILPTFAAMQSSLGAIYYAPDGTYRVSVENNFSAYAGLNILRGTLRAELAGQRDLAEADRVRIRSALAVVDRTIQGLLGFFKQAAWHEGEFVQGGIGQAWVPTLTLKAVDVNTWGVAALGPRKIDEWFGLGAAYRLWQAVKSWGGYGVGRDVWGVGYSDLDGNGHDAAGVYRQGVLSAEWTAGAILMVRSMRSYYAASDKGQQFVASLESDERTMLAGVASLRVDRYAAASFPGKPANYEQLISVPTRPYLYASRRYRVPFGWYANPIPSTCATAWMVMIADDYDPFGYGGQHN